MKISIHILLVSFVLGCPTNPLHAQQNLVDPLESSMWEDMRLSLLGGAKVVFDDRVRVLAPDDAEDSMNVPVLVDASALGKVSRIVVFAELNPIHKVLEMEPLHAKPLVGFRIKVQQATPIRAAVLTQDGQWHVGRAHSGCGRGWLYPAQPWQ